MNELPIDDEVSVEGTENSGRVWLTLGKKCLRITADFLGSIIIILHSKKSPKVYCASQLMLLCQHKYHHLPCHLLKLLYLHLSPWLSWTSCMTCCSPSWCLVMGTRESWLQGLHMLLPSVWKDYPLTAKYLTMV